ncbi:hypothetical protein KAFR_0F02150 [Kazachstania africana CBS 2517]|uniref:N-terminal acetyltransferase A complex subunit NAT1 n=1 Tax=Kazachstania africana (strain ATCC 22294 / BCRC 22015 / CBS 2517 / CECT 1963 / NBRC 1671 / NRRL Y-8276) TaxID=1071382 RepID=H2AWR2_KAZAF|nr:hypothetical protein KAFR_0F02150 [Kazachstania africana CBS 2517]CCF58812.1 hypothetical protein KAFR_0F02150 [Kazachstania africana CBS 2517]
MKAKGKQAAKPKSASKPNAQENAQFLEALKLFEGKNYKKSIKILDPLLKKDPSYVDALALKGLDLFSIGEKTEAASLVTNAISKIKGTDASSICCHVLGIYMRNTKDYKGSINWFQASLANGSNNYQIYRDLATLQSQVGDFKGAEFSRQQYLSVAMGYRANWTGLAIAHDINNHPQEAVKLLTQFEKLTEGKIGPAEAYEDSECKMYKIDVMYRSAGSTKDKLYSALQQLEQEESKITDKFAVLETKASIYMKLGKFKEASIMYRTLISRNPDDFKYYTLLEASLGIQSNNKLRKALYEKLATFYPRCEPPNFIPLTFIEDEAVLKTRLDEYVLPQLKRGVPAAFSNVKPLYQKRKAIVPQLLEDSITTYFNKLDPMEHPGEYIWTCYYLSQHYLFTRNFTKAQEFIELAVNHTPTMVEFYIVKARVLKHIGLLNEAAETMEEARKLDLQDRFINCKTVKYYLRANNIEKAVEIASLFTKNDDAANGVKDLHLVEASWFILEQAEAYYRLYIENSKKLNELKNKNGSEEDEELKKQLQNLQWTVSKFEGLSLKRFLAISKFYKQFEDDQLDFHSYCMRKGTPRTYLEMLEWGKKLYTNPMYVRAMKGAATIYFDLHDRSLKRKNEDGEEAEDNKPLIKQGNKKAKKEETQASKRKEQEANEVRAYPTDQDSDVFGQKLLSTATPLADFNDHFFENYCEQVKDYERDYILEFEYHYRTGKLALCLGSLTKLVKRDADIKKSGIFAAIAIKLLLATREATPFDAVAKKVVIRGFETEFEDFPINEVENEQFDWLNYFQENFENISINSLLFLNKIDSLDKLKIKNLILEKTANADPYTQINILQYKL